MCNPSIGCYLCVNVTSFTLLQVDLSLEYVDFFGLHFKFLLEVLFQFFHLTFLFIVLINENSLIGRVKLAVQLELFFT